MAAANRDLLANIVWTRFWAIQLLLLVMIVMYTTTSELVRLIGRENFRRMFFGPLPNLQPRTTS